MRIEVPLGTESKLIARAEQFVRVHREVDIRRDGRIDAEESRRRHAQHRKRQAVDPDGPSHGVAGSAEAILSQCVTDHNNRSSTRPIIVWRDQSPGYPK